MITTDYINTY